MTLNGVLKFLPSPVMIISQNQHDKIHSKKQSRQLFDMELQVFEKLISFLFSTKLIKTIVVNISCERH